MEGVCKYFAHVCEMQSIKVCFSRVCVCQCGYQIMTKYGQNSVEYSNVWLPVQFLFQHCKTLHFLVEREG